MPKPEEDAPDPATEQVLGKVRRIMLISLGLTGIAVGAVFAVIGYRVSTSEGSRPAANVTQMLPKGARVVSTAVADGRIAVTIEDAGVTEMRLFDLGTLEARGTLRLAPTP